MPTLSTSGTTAQQHQSVPGSQDKSHQGILHAKSKITSNTSSSNSAGVGGDSSLLMGLVHYGSESDDEGGGARPGTNVALKGGGKDGASNGSSNHAESDREETTATSHSLPGYPEQADDDLPKGWQQCMDKTGSVYFWNTESGETTWELPGRRGTTSAPDVTASPAPADTVPGKNWTATDATAVSTASRVGEGETSDATSDTASESNEEGVDDQLKEGRNHLSVSASRTATAPSSNTSTRVNAATLTRDESAKNRAGDTPDSGNKVVADEGENAGGAEDKPEADAPLPDGKHHVKPSDVERQDSAGEISSTTQESASGGGEVDDLLAGIEAELLSGGTGTTGASDTGDVDRDQSGDKTFSNDPAEEDGVSQGEDFTELRAISEVLQARAVEARADLGRWLSLVAANREGEAQGEGSKKRVLAIEMRAVLRARVSDWKEGESRR